MASVDHAVTYSWWRGFGPKGGDRITTYRHQNLIREDKQLIGSRREAEQPRDTHFSNLETGSSASIGPNAITISRAKGAEPLYRRISTGERRRIAGESCTMWRAVPIKEHGVEHRACVTDDGVVLYEAALYRDGSTMEERIALRVERRPVSKAEVLPPRLALSWPHWVHRLRNPITKGLNFEVRLTQSNTPAGHVFEKYHRAAGGWESAESLSDGKAELVMMRHASGALSLMASHDTLTISMRETVNASLPERDAPVRRIGRGSDVVLGERCIWVEPLPVVHDAETVECRASDGLALITELRSWGSLFRYEATSVTRGRTIVADVVPPAPLLSWANWGWPELGR